MKLPVISGQELIKALFKLGYQADHVTGSHVALVRTGPPHLRVTVPNHRELDRGTLRAIMRQVGLTHEKLIELL